jgi:hypothetical protein
MSPNPIAPLLAPGDFANLAPESEDRDTLIGVSTMKAQLLYQIAQNLATMAVPSTPGTSQTVAVTVNFDPTTIPTLSAALAAAVQPKFAELDTRLKAMSEKIDCLVREQAEQNEKFTCQVRELREEVMRLFEIECREPCGRMMAEIELLAARLEVCEAALPKPKR